MPAEEHVPEEVVIVVAGGPPPLAAAGTEAPSGAPVVAADDGLEHALGLRLRVSTAVGDFDSASAAALAAAEGAGARIERHPTAKDATDLELALDAALGFEPARVLLLAGDGGRLDHQLATLLLLGSEKYRGVEIDALIGHARVHVVRGERALSGERGELLTLLAVNGPAEGVRTDGLAYPLRGERLEPGSSRGVSNVFAGKRVLISVERGVLLAVRPGREETA
jgi:thiamine pyrophosphokinase